MTEPIEGQTPPPEGSVPPETKGDDVRQIIREELKELLPEFLTNATGQTQTPPSTETEEEKFSAKDLESVAKKAVEEAMEALKIKAPTQKAAPKKEPEEKKEETKKESETAPVNAGTKKWNLQKILWGE